MKIIFEKKSTELLSKFISLFSKKKFVYFFNFYSFLMNSKNRIFTMKKFIIVILKIGDFLKNCKVFLRMAKDLKKELII